MHQYITVKPSFNELADLRTDIQSLLGMLSALADEGDTPQRASDLLNSIDKLKKKANNLLIEELSE